jgi:hypothetical protein
MNRAISSSSQSFTISGPSSSNQGQWRNSQMTVRNRDLEAPYIHEDVVSHMVVADGTKEDSTRPTLARAWSTSMTSSMNNDLLSEDKDLDPVQEVHMHVPAGASSWTPTFSFPLIFATRIIRNSTRTSRHDSLQ